MKFAVALIVVGGLFLLKNLELFDPFEWGIVWPSALIILGAWMIYRKRDFCGCGKPGCPVCSVGDFEKK